MLSLHDLKALSEKVTPEQYIIDSDRSLAGCGVCATL